MSGNALKSALISCNESGESEKVIRFINQLSSNFGTDGETLDKLVGVASLAISYENDSVFQAASDSLYDYYLSLDQFKDNAAQKLNIILAAYEMGAALVLAKRWDLISPFVNRNSPAYGNYIYASWLRDCQVASSRHGFFDEKDSGMIISAALEKGKKHPIGMPDLNLGSKVTDGYSDEEKALNLLCSFDFLYCLCVFAAGDGYGEAYPCCCAYSESRINLVAAKMLGKDDVARRMLLPDCTDEEIASGLRKICELIQNEFRRTFNYYWALVPPAGPISSYLKEHPAAKQ